MEEYILHNFGEKDHGTLKELYNKILKYRDDHWHFFYEGRYSLLRISNVSTEDVRKFLNDKDISYEHLGEWKEPWDITNKYKKMFQQMFHAFSVLCIEMTEEEFPEILDRVTHCFLNNARTPERTSGKLLWEPMTLHEIATNRAYTIGAIMEGVRNERIRSATG